MISLGWSVGEEQALMIGCKTSEDDAVVAMDERPMMTRWVNVEATILDNQPVLEDFDRVCRISSSCSR